MSEAITNFKQEARKKIDEIYGQGTDEAETAWDYNQSRLNTLRPGDETSNYVGRPDIQWGIIIDELETESAINTGHQALAGANTYLSLVEDSSWTLAQEDLAEAV